MFDDNEDKLIFELIYEGDKSLMSAKDLGEAIIGMSTCIAIAGRDAKLDFESVYIFPIETGSIRTLFTFTRREKNEIKIQTVSAVLGGTVTAAFIGAFSLIGQYGLPALKAPSGDILENVNKKAIELCTNAEFRRSVPKIARPISEINQRVTLKVQNNSYEINCDNQYKFIAEDEEPILPELKNGETVSLPGSLTRMNMKNNDLGFDYHNKTLALTPIDPDKNVAVEYHQYTPLPKVIVTGVVVRESEFETPKIKVIRIEEFKSTQTNLFDDTRSESASK